MELSPPDQPSHRCDELDGLPQTHVICENGSLASKHPGNPTSLKRIQIIMGLKREQEWQHDIEFPVMGMLPARSRIERPGERLWCLLMDLPRNSRITAQQSHARFDNSGRRSDRGGTRDPGVSYA